MKFWIFSFFFFAFSPNFLIQNKENRKIDIPRIWWNLKNVVFILHTSLTLIFMFSWQWWQLHLSVNFIVDLQTRRAYVCYSSSFFFMMKNFIEWTKIDIEKKR